MVRSLHDGVRARNLPLAKLTELSVWVAAFYGERSESPAATYMTYIRKGPSRAVAPKVIPRTAICVVTPPAWASPRSVQTMALGPSA
jgi:hypothetical protein